MKLQHIATVASIVLLLFYVSTWHRYDPHDADFSAFYSGALLFQRGQPVYDRAEACSIQAPLGIEFCMPFFHPPVLLPLLSVVSTDNYTSSYRRWVLILLVVALICAGVIYRLIESVPVVLAALTFLPMLFTFLHGQDSLVVLLGLLLFGMFIREGREIQAGIALSLTVLRPTLAIALGMPLILANRKVFYSFVLSSLILTLYSLALVGPQGFFDLAHALVSSGQSDPTTRPDRMYSIVGVLVWVGTKPAFAWLAFAASVPWIAWIWKKHGLTPSSFGQAITITVLTSPHLHLHDLVFLIVPLIGWPSFVIPMLSLVMLMLFSFSQPLGLLIMSGLIVLSPHKGTGNKMSSLTK